jgi:hypothetical protein
MNYFEILVEKKISEAMEQGEFDRVIQQIEDNDKKKSSQES